MLLEVLQEPWRLVLGEGRISENVVGEFCLHMGKNENQEPRLVALFSTVFTFLLKR